MIQGLILSCDDLYRAIQNRKSLRLLGEIDKKQGYKPFKTKLIKSVEAHMFFRIPLGIFFAQSTNCIYDLWNCNAYHLLLGFNPAFI